MKKYSAILLLTLAFNALLAQQVERCGHDLLMQQYETKYPGFNQARNHSFEEARNAIYSNNRKAAVRPDSVLKIPVVVHLVYKNATENLHDSLVYNQIEMLNKSFRMTDPDTANVRAEFDTLRGDAHIEFYLTKVDENGDSTTGITRTQTNTQGFFDFADLDKIKKPNEGGVAAWDADKFLNIWVGDMSFNGQPGVLGYAYPPTGGVDSIWPAGASAPSSNLDGVVVHYEVFGDGNPLATGGQLVNVADRGRTAVHEVGHFLGLRHIWGDGGNPLFPGPPDCSVDDGIKDTPNAGNNSQQTGCQNSKNTCSPQSGYDYPDMWENYMDYSEESCQVIFTHDQIAIMRYNLLNPRAGLAEEGERQNPSEPQEPSDSVNVGINDVDVEMGLNLYPNPSSGLVNIEFNNVKDNSTVSVIGIDGKVVANQNVAANTNSLYLNLNELQSGIYFVRLQNNKGTAYQRLVIR